MDWWIIKEKLRFFLLVSPSFSVTKDILQPESQEPAYFSGNQKTAKIQPTFA